MPETPDFEQIAESLVHEAAMVIGATRAGTDCLAARRIIVEQLRLIWNARGAADIATLETLEVIEHGDKYVKILDRALRTLDR